MRDPHFCFVGAMFAQNPFCTKCKSKQRSVLHKIKTKIQFSNIYLSLSYCPMDPLLNGKIERKSDHLLDLPRAQLSDAINIVAVNRYFAILVLHCGTYCERLPFWYSIVTTFHLHCGTLWCILSYQHSWLFHCAGLTSLLQLLRLDITVIAIMAFVACQHCH